MARLPCKALRFLVWISASREYRDDALIAYDEVFNDTYMKFGPFYAHWWSVNQAMRSLPYGLVITVVKVATSIAAIVS